MLSRQPSSPATARIRCRVSELTPGRVELSGDAGSLVLLRNSSLTDEQAAVGGVGTARSYDSSGRLLTESSDLGDVLVAAGGFTVVSAD